MVLTTPTRRSHHHAERIRRLRRQMLSRRVSAVALASPENIYYLTGLDHLGYFAFTLLVVPRRGTPVLVTRAMERATIRAMVPWCRHLVFDEDEPAAEVAASALAEPLRLGGELAWDEDSMFFPPSIADGIRRRLPGARWRNASPMMHTLRGVKSPPEIAHTREAARLSDLAMAAGIAALRPGDHERAVAASVYRAMIAEGGEPPGFAPLIRPLAILDQEHTTWSNGVVRSGQGWFLELSASVRRYHAPLSRTVYVGSAPPGAEAAAERALAGLRAACAALVPGARAGEVYAAWERAACGPGAGPRRHHCGYLVGIGFPPSWVGGGTVAGIRPGGRLTITPGMTFHLMSWVTSPTGHVVSDTALVTDSGAELLTTTHRELTVLAPEGG